MRWSEIWQPIAFIALMCLAVGLWSECGAHADGSAAKALALDVARVCANEAFGSPADCALVWQVVEGRARTVEDRHAWLRRHSPCVTGQREEPGPGNCRWTRNLSWGSTSPRGWPSTWDWERYSGTWARTRRLAWGLVTGQVRRRPCEQTPETWGGPMDHDRALRRGLRRIDCQGTRNAGYVRAEQLHTPAEPER